MQVEEILAKVKEILVVEFELDEEAVVPGARLREDLDLDSLDGVDLVVALEDAFGFRVEDKVIAKMKTVGDIYEQVRIQAELHANE